MNNDKDKQHNVVAFDLTHLDKDAKPDTGIRVIDGVRITHTQLESAIFQASMILTRMMAVSGIVGEIALLTLIHVACYMAAVRGGHVKSERDVDDAALSAWRDAVYVDMQRVASLVRKLDSPDTHTPNA
jgi:hypothetical protein